MDPAQDQPTIKLYSKSYAKTWKQFYDRAMDILVQSPSRARYIIKYIPNRRVFVLKVTEGNKIIMKRCHPNNVSLTNIQDYEQVEKFTRLAGRALANQPQTKKEQEVDREAQGKKKKKKKR